MALATLEQMALYMKTIEDSMGLTPDKMATLNDTDFGRIAGRSGIKSSYYNWNSRSDDLIENVLKYKSQITDISFTSRHFKRAQSANGIINPKVHTKENPYLTLGYIKPGNGTLVTEFIMQIDLKDSCTPSLYNQLIAVIEDIIEMPIDEFTQDNFNYVE